KNRHPAPFPLALIERIISSTIAKIVLDPFMGSGTTALAAKNLNRNFIGIDLAPEYCDMALQRLNDPLSVEKSRKIQQAPLFAVGI
ncbi:MAG: site-specific DNA-methyltransferase, partial [Gemmatimonadetes bacterium]|nr:site-specific DNA-methyltransferase [Gemmatimonadota bacterium]